MHAAQQRHAQRQRAHRGSRVLPKRKHQNDRDDDGDDDDDDEKRKRKDDAEKRKKKKRKGTVANEGPSSDQPHVVAAVADDDDAGGNDGNNLFVDDSSSHRSPPPPPPPTPPSSPSSTSSSPSPTTVAEEEPLCRSIIAVGSSRLHPDDPYLRALPPEARRLYEDSDFDEEFVCELRSTGETVPLSSSGRQLAALRGALQGGTLVSGVSTIELVVPEVVVGVAVEEAVAAVAQTPSPSPPPTPPSSQVIGAAASSSAPLPSSSPSTTATAATTTVVIESVALPPGDVHIRTDPDVLGGGGGRSLLRYSGTRPVLAVRVTAQGEGGSLAHDAAVVSNKLFGTSGDAETMASQFASCSYGNFNVAIDESYGGRLSAPGVLDVEIPMSLDNTRSDIRKAMQRAAEEKLGVKLPGPFGHVLFVQGRCQQDCGWAAYAYVNSWLSVYQGDYFMYPAVTMHEVGHNLNFGHSGGLDLKTYSDHTCLMGNPLYKDDVADMCFNPAKNYQITANGGGWYDPGRVETYDTAANSAIWDGKLVGIAEYGNLHGNAEHDRSRVVLKVETGTLIDLYMGFNRATGINEDNKQASNMVTIVEANGDGLSYSTSALKATLAQGQSYAVSNWRGTGVTLTVYVDAIRIDVVPGYAAVRVVLDGNRSGGITTLTPTMRPSRMPTTTRPTKAPVLKPTRPPTPSPTTPPTPPPPTPVPTPPVSYVDVIYVFVSFSRSSLSLRGACLLRALSFCFVYCASKLIPLPTPYPTPEPTLPPPTPEPTLPPTPSPTPSPTLSPTPSPTLSPVTQSPVTLSPVTLSPVTLSPVTQSPVEETSVSLEKSCWHTYDFCFSYTFIVSRNLINRILFSTAQFELSTDFANSRGRTKSIMFTIKNIANRDVVIRGLEIVNRRSVNTLVTIYTRAGSIEELGDAALNPEGWNITYQSEKLGETMRLLDLGHFASEVRIGSGQAQSFYIHSAKSLMYGKNNNTANEMISKITQQDGAIEILEGRVLRGLFRLPIGYGKWDGVVKYDMN